MDFKKHEIKHMKRAIKIAAKARGNSSPNPLVGCVLVKSGKVIATGYHKKAGLPHAEAEALAKAGSKARGATAFVTLEPCSHTGRTAPLALLPAFAKASASAWRRQADDARVRAWT